MKGLIFLINLNLVFSTYNISYYCFPKGENDGLCISEGNPNYKYKIRIDYEDMSLKVFASSNTIEYPSYVCTIFGWLTPSDVTLKCISKTNILYCSGNKEFSVCTD